MSEIMQAFRMLDWGQDPVMSEVPVPTVGPGQVLVRVAGVGVCGADPKMKSIPKEFGLQMGWNMPFTLGHETGGWIEQVGEGVKGFEKGEAVVLVGQFSCGVCSFCREGADINCPHGVAGRGYGRDGGMAKYVLVENARGLIKLKTLDPRTSGPLVDAGATSYHGVRRLLPRLRPGTIALIIGPGGLGAFAVQFIKVLSPARVICLDTNEARLDYAQELGADHVINSSKTNADAAVRELAPGGVHAVMDFVGLDATIDTGIGALRAGGGFALVGSAPGKLTRDWINSLPKDGEVFTYQGSSIADTEDVVRLVEEGKIRNDVELYRFDQVEEAYGKLVRGELQGRAVIQVCGD